jgi:pimeloyl-ACP methyl ester carboxylesterase
MTDSEMPDPVSSLRRKPLYGDVIAKDVSPSGQIGHPVSFEGCTGIFHPAREDQRKDTGVLFVSPWGMEELCARKFQRIIAERLGVAGVSSLRFDYPGAGDALDPADLNGPADWAEAARHAATLLKRLSGCSRLVIIAQGVGCPIAFEAFAGTATVDAMVLMAPVVSGRSYLRELAMWSSMIDDGLGLRADQRATKAGSIAGMTMPDTVADTIRKANLMKASAKPASCCLMVLRPGRVTETDFSAHLASLGTVIDEAVFSGYDELVSSPTLSKIPYDVVDHVVGWIDASTNRDATASLKTDGLLNPPQTGQGFVEQPVQFGDGGRLFGVVCEPTEQPVKASVLFLSSAYDRHSGWGRLSVNMARELARCGIASLRFDAANVADSPAAPGIPDQVLYDDSQTDDVRAALDFMDQRVGGRVVAAGRCSGAYLAFNAALADERIKGTIAVNPVVFYWEKGRSVDEALYKKPRSFGEYRQRFLQGATFKRVFQGDVDVVSAVVNIGKAVSKRIAVKTARLFRGRSEEGRAVYSAFDSLKARGTAVELLYSDNDDGLAHFSYYFDTSGKGLAAYPNVAFRIIPDADHNLSPAHARQTYLDAVKAMALRS